MNERLSELNFFEMIAMIFPSWGVVMFGTKGTFFFEVENAGSIAGCQVFFFPFVGYHVIEPSRRFDT